MMADEGPEERPDAPNTRTFSLNSAEAYEALCPRDEEPWIKAGSLPRAPRGWPGRVERDPGPP